jgi:hypothetical protein
MGEPASDGRRPNRRRGDVSAAIGAYMQEHPHAGYFEMLNDLHARGYRVNRHGSTEMMRLWESAREVARSGRRR